MGSIQRLSALILGPPGGGKGTISKKLIKDYSFFHLSTGDVLRKHVREGTDVGKAAQAYMVKGTWSGWPTGGRWGGEIGVHGQGLRLRLAAAGFFTHPPTNNPIGQRGGSRGGKEGMDKSTWRRGRLRRRAAAAAGEVHPPTQPTHNQPPLMNPTRAHAGDFDGGGGASTHATHPPATLLIPHSQPHIPTGALVPDKVMVDLVVEELSSKGTVPRLLLDGFPRTIPQALALEAHIKMDVVIDLDIPDQTIIERISNRWIHAPSGRTYAYDYNPPKEKGKDDVTGEALVQREDDKAETVKARLDQYKKVTSPLVEHYRAKGTLATFAGTESNVIYPRVKAYLEEFLAKRV